jgi:hypothetical protein
MRQEGTNGTRNRDFEKNLRLESDRATSRIYRKTIGLEIVKRAVGISSGLRRGRPPQKQKKNVVALLAMLAQEEKNFLTMVIT